MGRRSVSILFLLLGGCIAGLVALVFSSQAYEVEGVRIGTVEKGFSTKTLTLESGQDAPFVVFVPYRPCDQGKYPVLLFLNGEGEDGQDGIRQVSNNFGRQIWELKAGFPFIAVAPQRHKFGSWASDSEDTQAALAVLDHILEDYNGDPERVCLTGPSSGGQGVYEIGTAHPERFAAIVPISAFSPPAPPEQIASTLAAHNMPVWSFYNGGDNPGLVKFNRQMRAAMVQAGISPIVMEFDRNDHDAWSYALRNPALYDWLLRQSLWKREKPHTSFVSLTSGDLKRWESEGPGNWSVDERDFVSFTPDDAGNREAEGRLTLKTPVIDTEFHFDFFARGKSLPQIELSAVPPRNTAGTMRIVLRMPDQGSGGVVVPGTGEWLASADPIAQNAMRPNIWNNVRIRRKGSHLSVRVNGWQMISLNSTVLDNDELKITLCGDQSLLWREVRAQKIDDVRAEVRR